jgi:hypothetical protein
MTEASPPTNPQSVAGLLLRFGFVIAFATAAVGADYLGWLTGDSGALLYYAVLVALVIILVLSLDGQRLRGGYLWFMLVILMIAPQLLRIEAQRTREVAEWRILLMETCASADPASPFAERCGEARVRADYEPCDFGTTAEQCRRELYRDARRTLRETPIPPHSYGDTLPTGNAT